MNRISGVMVSVTEVQCTLQRGELAVCTNNGTRGQSIVRLKLPVDIAKAQASFNIHHCDLACLP